MKIRKGFVSNSSSSSFMVSLPDLKKETTECEISIKVDLRHFGDAIFRSLEELREYFLGEEDWEEEELEGVSWYKKAKKELASGRVIMYGTVGSEGGENIAGALLYDQGLKKTIKNKNMKILQDAEC